MTLLALMLFLAQDKDAGVALPPPSPPPTVRPATAAPPAAPKIPRADARLVLVPGTEAAAELPEWAPALLDPAARPQGFVLPSGFQLCYDYYAEHFPGTANDSAELITTWRGRDPAKRNCALAAMTRALLAMQADEAAGKAGLFATFAKIRGTGWARGDESLRCDGDALVRAALPIAMAMGLTGGNAGYIEAMVFARPCPE